MASEYAQIAQKNAVESRKLKKNLKQIMKLPGNDQCADCGDHVNVANGWGSISFGIVLCVQCAGLHRSIGGNQIHSFALDTKPWCSTTNIELFRKIGGNTLANKRIWERFLSTFQINPKYDKLLAKSQRSALLSLFIKSKYEKQLWTPKNKSESHKLASGKDYIKKMPIDVRENLLFFYDREKQMWCKKGQYLVVHGQFLSRYPSAKIKKNKCNDIETYDLLKLKVVINDSLLGDEQLNDDEFVFFLFEDSSYIPASIARLASGISMKRINSARQEAEIIRIKYVGTFQSFFKMICDIRATISYYRMYEQLVSIYNQGDEPLVIMNYDLQSGVFLGVGKVFGSTKCYFFAINDTLYGLSGKKDPRSVYAADDKCAHLNAKYGWHLNKIDVMLDENGKRTGSKFALLLILKNKTIFIKFDKGPLVVQFFTLLQKEMTNTKGRYVVNFSCDPPTIIGEGNDADDMKEEAPQAMPNHLTIERMTSLRQQSHHKKSPTQILEIISQIQINEEQNGPVIYESEEEEEEPPPAQHIQHEDSADYVYEFMQPQNSTDLMQLPPPPPNFQAAAAPDSPKKKLQGQPPPVPQMLPVLSQKESQKQAKKEAKAKAKAAKQQAELQAKLRLEQEKKQREYEKRKGEEAAARLALEKAVAEEERLRMKRELEAAKAQAAEEVRKRKELEKETAQRLELERQKTAEKERERRRKEEERREREEEREREEKQRIQKKKEMAAEAERQRRAREAAAAAQPPAPINPEHGMLNGQNVVMGSPKTWEQLEQRAINKKQNPQQAAAARSVEEALANKYANNNDESSGDSSSSSDSGFTSSDDAEEEEEEEQQQQPQHLKPQQQMQQAQQRGSWQGPPNANFSANQIQQGQRGSWQGQQGQMHQQSYSQSMQKMAAAYNQQAAANWNQQHQRDQSQPVKMAYGAGAAYGAYGAANKMQYNNNYQQQQQKPVNNDVIKQQAAELNFFAKPELKLSAASAARWTCKMCTFENKADATTCDMCTVARPKGKSGASFNEILSPQELKDLHAKMTYHYQQYTQLQRLPPLKQQEMHKEMTYHYQQYSIMYKEYQKQQQKPKVVKKRKSKLVGNKEMQYLKLTRIFSMNDQQQVYLSNPAKFHKIQQSFGQYARITAVPQNKCYQIAIPNNIPLPRRKQHWLQIISIIRQQIGVSQEI